MITPTKYPYYEVHFMKAGDADSIILAYKRDVTSNLVLVLIDAGNVTNANQIKEIIKERWKRNWVDIAVLTHPDTDHKGGFFGLLQDDKFEIKEFWTCLPWISHYEDLTPGAEPILMPSIKDSIKIYSHPTDESINLIKLLCDRGVKIRDVSQGDDGLPIIPLKVVGPTLEFSDRNASIMVSDFKEISDDETFEAYVEDAEMTDEDAVSVIDKEEDDTSATNMSSLILMFDPGRKFLLTGDATRASLKAMIDENPSLFKNCVLKVPHHGSKHNLNTELINMLEPQQSAICARGSKKHPNNSVVYWLSKTGNVYLTERGYFWYTSEPHNNSATPLKYKIEK